MIAPDLVGKFQETLPCVREWVEATLKAHQDQAVPLDPRVYPRLNQFFPGTVLNRARVVVVADNPPFPPLSRMGLPEFVSFEAMPIAGITYQNTFFVKHGQQTESLYFHEIVHVVQWGRLGVDHFLLAYAVGLMQAGYRNSPLEEMAYALQDGFDRGNLPGDIIGQIQHETDGIWKAVLSQLDGVAMVTK
jgi:hypothetical protein